MKTIERAHTPAKLWQKVRLASSYAKALQQVDEHLAHFPKFLAHKNKQRLTKITQYLIRARRLALRPKPTLVPLATRTEQRERRREAKAEQAARLETSIEQELLQRLRSGTYGDIYNFPEKEYEAVLDRAEAEMEEEGDGKAEKGARYVEGDSDDEEDEDEEDYELEYEGEEDGDDGGELEEDSEGPEDPSEDEEEAERGAARGGGRQRRGGGNDIEDLAGPSSTSAAAAAAAASGKRGRGISCGDGGGKGKGPATPALRGAKRARGGESGGGSGGGGSGKEGGRRELEMEVEREGVRSRR